MISSIARFNREEINLIDNHIQEIWKRFLWKRTLIGKGRVRWRDRSIRKRFTKRRGWVMNVCWGTMKISSFLAKGEVYVGHRRSRRSKMQLRVLNPIKVIRRKRLWTLHRGQIRLMIVSSTKWLTIRKEVEIVKLRATINRDIVENRQQYRVTIRI